MNNTNKLSLVTMAVIGVMSSTAMADETASLDAVVVSASGFEQDIKQAPASISIVNAKDMKKMPIRDVGDAVQSEPGVEVSKGKTGSSQISIRGFEPQYTAILIDGKRQNASYGIVKNGFDPNGAFMPSIDQIERVEVIRGPASVLYGSDAIGGVVNIITKKNFNEFSGSLTLDALVQEENRYGNAFSQSARFNIPLVENKLSLSLHGRNYTKDGSNIRKPDGAYAGRSSGEYDNYTYGGLINYQITDKQRVYFDIDKAIDSGIVNNTSNESLRIQRDWERLKYSLNYDGSFDSADINASVSYNDTKQVGSAQSGRNGTGPMQDKPFTQLESEYWIAKANAVTRHDTSIGFFNLNTGFEFMHERFYDGKAASFGDSYVKQNNIAVYEEAEYFITDDLSTTVGVRVSDSSTYDMAISPRAYLVFQATDALTLKAGVATGYKIGSLDQMQPGITNVSNSNGSSYLYYGNPELKEEKSINYELSAIYAAKNVGTFSLTGFYTDFKNKIETTRFEKDEVFNGNKCTAIGDNGYCLAYDNVAKSHVYGIESSYKSPVFNNFNLDLNYTFTKSKIDEGSPKKVGKPVSETPRHAIYVKLNYENNGFSAYAKANAKLKTPVTSPTTGQDPWYKDSFVVDLGTSYSFNKHHTVSFVVSNLFNTDFDTFQTITTQGSNGKTSTRYVSDYHDYIEGRNYYLSYNYSF